MFFASDHDNYYDVSINDVHNDDEMKPNVYQFKQKQKKVCQ